MPAPARFTVPRVTAHSSDGNLSPSTSAVILVIWRHRGRELWAASVLEASQLLVHQRGTVCRHSSRTRHWLLDSSLAAS